MPLQRTRREFLKQGSAAGLGFWVAGGLTATESKSANEKINFASIGVGGKGSSDCAHAGALGNMVAICDIDDEPLDKMAQRFPKAKKYHDFRKMLEEMDKEIDAVTVSTPDHTHAPASVMAMKMKKHVYCQKPLTHSVYEARVMKETAQKMGVATQMGNQGTAENGLRRAVEIVQSGGIGPVREVHVWTNRPVWPQSPGITSRPTGTPPIPKNVHWDLFLGPAPERSYNPAYHPFKWRGWWDFGTGALGDMACHTANMAFMALKLTAPITIEAENEAINPETYPGWARIKFEFPARDGMPPVVLTWYEGRKDGNLVWPPEELLAKVLKPGQKLSSSGSLLVGDKGILFSPNDYGAAFSMLPEEEFKDYKAPEPTLARNGRGDLGMKREWVEAMRGGPKAFSNFDYAAALNESILLGNVAMRVGKKLEWDSYNLKATNCPEADQFVRREYRKGWAL